MPSPKSFGQSAEDLAEQMLRKKGYRIVERNLRVGGGELDFIAEYNGILIFIEVKARRTRQFGGAPYAIDSRKKASNYSVGLLLSCTTAIIQSSLPF